MIEYIEQNLGLIFFLMIIFLIHIYLGRIIWKHFRGWLVIYDYVKRYPVDEEFLHGHDDDLEVSYGLKKEERVFNSNLNRREIQDLKTLNNSAKSVLLENNILTVADLKSNSLNFLLDFFENSIAINERLEVFHDCKAFLNSIDFSNGKSYIDY